MYKKILNYIGLIGFIVFIYFNYIKEPEIIEKKPQEALVTTGVSYDAEGYHVEAEKQIDNNKDKTRTFEKAKALFDGMKLSGDHASVDGNNNMFLKDNIFGIATNGWKIEANKANYNKAEEKIYANDEVKAYNEKEGITIFGNSLVTDTKLEDLNLKDDIRVLTDKLQLSANYAHYNDKTKIMNLKENIKIRGRQLGKLQKDDISGNLSEVTYDGIKKNNSRYR